MPAYVGFTSIDWHYDRAAPSLQPIIQDANASLGSSNHTYDTFIEDLQAFAEAHPSLVAEALLEDGYRCMHLFEVEKGQVRDEWVFDENKPWDDVIVVDDDYLPLEYDTEEAMRAAVNLAAKGGAKGACVTAVEERRFHVTIAKRRATIEELALKIDRDLYLRLARRNYPEVPHPPRQPDEKYEQTLTLRKTAFELLQKEAVRTDRSLSFIAQIAWKHACGAIAAAPREKVQAAAGTFIGDEGKLDLYFTGAMLDEIAAQAARSETSLSAIVSAALALAKPQIAALPTVDEFPGAEP